MSSKSNYSIRKHSWRLTTRRQTVHCHAFQVCWVHCVLALVFFTCASVSSGEPIDYGNARWTLPIPVPGAVNSGVFEANSSISADGLTMYWDSAREQSALGLGDEELCCIWTATRPSLDAPWENPRPLDGPFRSTGPEGEAEPDITGDGLELFFVRDGGFAREDGHAESPDDELWVARRASVDEPWAEATKLSDAVHSLGCVSDPSVTDDGLELYFDVGIGSCDNQRIHVSKRASRDEPFGPPTPVLDGLLPGISSDGLHLFYRTPNEVQLYVASRNSRDEEFGAEQQLPSPFRTDDFSPELSSDGQTLYFTSFRNGLPEHPDWPFGNTDELWQSSIAEPCDFDRDGTCGVSDLSRRALFRVDLTEGTDRPVRVREYDIDGDDFVDGGDLSFWLDEMAQRHGFSSTFLAGDTDLNGIVNFEDFLSLSANFGTGNQDWADGNFNGDRAVDFADFLNLSANFGMELTPREVTTTPEPAGIWFALFGMLGMVGFRRRR